MDLTLTRTKNPSQSHKRAFTKSLWKLLMWRKRSIFSEIAPMQRDTSGAAASRYLFILNWVAILSKHSATRDTCVTHLLEHDGEPSSTDAWSRHRLSCRKEKEGKKTSKHKTLNRTPLRCDILFSRFKKQKTMLWT